MFRRWLNHATVHVAISPRGPILIKSGHETADPTRPGMEFVRTRHAIYGDSVYLPGTSLKGSMRSQAERVLRGLGIEICDPFNDRSRCRRGPQQEHSQHGSRRPPPPSSAEIFSIQCPACQTFGSLKVAGRCNVEDAYPWNGNGRADADAANATETRWQVGIDRLTGQAQRAALFDLEVAVAGTFHTTIHLENFALWQLGLIGALLEDMNHGDLAIGFGKTRGLGQVSVAIEKIEIETLGRNGGRLLGAGALCQQVEARSYGLDSDDGMDLPGAAAPKDTWRGRRVTVEGQSAQDLFAALMTDPLKRWVEVRAAAGDRR
jgi:CRISPR/Cas system CSM-associated protein Csm3 (group 7 of RAMP superfamily)